MKLDLLSSASLLALGGVLTLSVPGAARASLVCTSTGTTGSCTDTIVVPPTTTDFGTNFVPAYTDSNNVVHSAVNATSSVVALIPQFNPSTNEHLTSVTLTEGGDYVSNGYLKNTDVGTQSFSFSISVGLNMYLNPAAAATLVGKAQGRSYSYTDVPAGGTGGFHDAQNFVANPLTLTSSLTGFLGSGTLDALFVSQVSQSFSFAANAKANLTTTASPTVTVTYYYSITPPVSTPEPASLAILGAGLGGLGVIRRRRKR